MYPDRTDSELISLLTTEHPTAIWHTIYERHAEMMFKSVDSYAPRYGLNASDIDAEDIVHTIFQELMTKGPQLVEQGIANLGGYLRTCVRNKVVDVSRSAQRASAYELDTEIPDAADDFEQALTRTVLSEAMHALDERQMQILAKTILEGRSNVEVGEDLSLSPQYIGRIQRNALALLREKLKDLQEVSL